MAQRVTEEFFPERDSRSRRAAGGLPEFRAWWAFGAPVAERQGYVSAERSRIGLMTWQPIALRSRFNRSNMASSE